MGTTVNLTNWQPGTKSPKPAKPPKNTNPGPPVSTTSPPPNTTHPFGVTKNVQGKGSPIPGGMYTPKSGPPSTTVDLKPKWSSQQIRESDSPQPTSRTGTRPSPMSGAVGYPTSAPPSPVISSPQPKRPQTDLLEERPQLFGLPAGDTEGPPTEKGTRTGERPSPMSGAVGYPTDAPPSPVISSPQPKRPQTDLLKDRPSLFGLPAGGTESGPPGTTPYAASGPTMTGLGTYIQDPGGRERLNQIQQNPSEYLEALDPVVQAKIMAGEALTANEYAQLGRSEIRKQTGLEVTGLSESGGGGRWNGLTPDRGPMGKVPDGSFPVYGQDGQLIWIAPNGNVYASNGALVNNANTLDPASFQYWRGIAESTGYPIPTNQIPQFADPANYPAYTGHLRTESGPPVGGEGTLPPTGEGGETFPPGGETLPPGEEPTQQGAGITLPPNWDTWTAQQQLQWFQDTFGDVWRSILNEFVTGQLLVPPPSLPDDDPRVVGGEDIFANQNGILWQWIGNNWVPLGSYDTETGVLDPAKLQDLIAALTGQAPAPQGEQQEAA